ncbi:MAG TPA: FAD-dependent oxidoreductase [Thermoplasmata archaeon]|jgi:glycine/D-amino acid oxidase-like deaminating enzyme|nr:FAD-dependent oxidoreductase [Thermoplasmata archaeon]
MGDGARDVAILGAGIAGAALANHLTSRSLSVTIVDPRTPAAGASGRAAGIVTEQLWNDWDVLVTRESREEYRTLARGDGEAFAPVPFVRLTAEPVIAEALRAAVGRLRGWGVPIEEVNADQLTEWFSGGKFERLQGAIASRSDACVTPSTITALYLDAARERGADVAFGAAVPVPVFEGGSWSVRSGSTEVRARSLVVAAGAWSKQLFLGLGRPLPLTPYRTQAAVLRPPPGPAAPAVSFHDLDTDVYGRPESNGRILAGDGTEWFETDPEKFVAGADASFLAHLAEGLGLWFPDWADSDVVGAWAGVCTATLDRRPCIGPVDPSRSLYAITGFNGFGVMRSGGSARRLAELIVDPTSTKAREALAPVLPERFAGAAPSFSPVPGFTLEAGSSPRF